MLTLELPLPHADLLVELLSAECERVSDKRWDVIFGEAEATDEERQASTDRLQHLRTMLGYVMAATREARK